jgi:Uma2 family endonuclease
MGEIVSLAPGGYEHSFSSANFVLLIGNFVKEHKLGRVLTNEAGMKIREQLPRVRGAGVAFISYKRIPRNKPPTGFLTVAPELVIEILGNEGSWKDLEEKVVDYHSIGVDMVWVADPHTRTVKTYPRGGEPSVIHDGSAIDGGAILPGFSVPIAQFFDE